MSNVFIQVTEDEVEVGRTDEAIGVYIGLNQPSWLQGQSNMFIAPNLTAAKHLAQEYLQDIRREIDWTIHDLKQIRVKDIT